ncbi:hypothetical protein [Chengkuizengella sediminis]|uniref:hypothetical protein n=1 Tax=Chengkuizengella sediminis TaxID=1885917 RepID=UPI0013893F9C|nr:hypothetical protein [Chengkuizengella sediminis]NDI35452.1 hypothetical protein [Chengkuizengella sediminis]
MQCNISALVLTSGIPMELNLKPKRKNVGECACCEDPITALFKVGQMVDIEYNSPLGTTGFGLVDNVGEGIVIMTIPEGTFIISTCTITNVLFQ